MKRPRCMRACRECKAWFYPKGAGYELCPGCEPVEVPTVADLRERLAR
jgi:hypothetical protein